MSIAGVEDEAIAKWFTTVFEADSIITAGATGGVWDGAASEGTPYPIIRFDPQSPGVVVRGNSTYEIMVNSLWLIRAIVDGSNFDPIVPLAQRIHLGIHGVTNLALPDGMIVACVREQAFRLETIQGGREFRHLGGIYRVLTQA